MRKPFGGTSLGAALGGGSPVTANSEIWMSWFDGGSSSDNAAATVPEVVNERKSERFLSSDREQKVSLEPEDDLEAGLGSVGERYNSMRQEIELAQRRLAVRERILNQDEPAPSSSGGDELPEIVKTSDQISLAVRLQRRPQSESTPPLPSMALWNNPGASPVPPVEKALKHSPILPAFTDVSAQESSSPLITKSPVDSRSAVMKVSEEKPTRELLSFAPLPLENTRAADKSILIDRIPSADKAGLTQNAAIGPFGMSESLRGPDSESSKLLKQYNLYDKFSGIECHEHISWGPDGSVSVALKSSDGFRRTIVCRADGTSAQRITDPTGKELVRFSANGQVVANLENRSA